MEFLCSLKQQTSLDTLDIPEGFAMGPVEEINHLKTDDSKNKSAPHHVAMKLPAKGTMGLEEGAKPIPDAPHGMSDAAMVPFSSIGLMSKETGHGRRNEEMVVQLKTDDSKNKSTLQHVTKMMPPIKVIY